MNRSGSDEAFLREVDDAVQRVAVVVVDMVEGRRREAAFAGLGLDLIDPSDIPGQFGTNQPHEDSMNGTVGAIYDLGQLKYIVSATYATTAILGNNTEHFYYLQPSVQWYVPRKFTFKSKTQWIVGLGVRTSWGPDGTDFSVRTRVRAEIPAEFRPWLLLEADSRRVSGQFIASFFMGWKSRLART